MADIQQSAAEQPKFQDGEMWRFVEHGGVPGTIRRWGIDGFESPSAKLHIDFSPFDPDRFADPATRRGRARAVPLPGPPHAPGGTLWDVIWRAIPAAVRDDILSKPRVVSPADIGEWIDIVFRAVGTGKIIVAGKSMPVAPGTPYVAIQAAEHSLWHFGIVTDRAAPRVAGSAASYAGLRVFSPQEWRVITRPDVHQMPVTPLPVSRGGRPPGHDWPAFTREVIRIASEDGLTNRRALCDLMVAWCTESWPSDKQPDRETVNKKLKELWPEQLPEV